VLSGTVIFSFEAVDAPPRGQAYEIAFWRPGQDAEADGFSPGQHFSGKLELNLEQLYTKRSDQFFPGDYLWGVRLIELKTLSPVRLLGEPRRFRFENRPRQGEGNGDQPTAVPPTDVPPTDVPPTDVPPTAVPPTPGKTAP
jgi:hypothetical protein